MKCLVRNKIKFFYALYDHRESLLDDYGNNTGEYSVTYGNPTECYGNISAAKGETTTRQFGDDESYDKIIVLDNYSPLIDEHTVLWVDTLPKTKSDGTLSKNENGEVVTPYDYIIKKVARSINSVSIAINKVNVS